MSLQNKNKSKYLLWDPQFSADTSLTWWWYFEFREAHFLPDYICQMALDIDIFWEGSENVFSSMENNFPHSTHFILCALSVLLEANEPGESLSLDLLMCGNVELLMGAG